MIKIAHEAPISIFNHVQVRTDYDYALVHLFEENENYLNKFKQAKNYGREIILDNSIFELGHSFDPTLFAKWINELKPTWYIIPDVLESYEGTVELLNEWKVVHKPHVTGKAIGVVQGKTYEEIVACYKQLEEVVDKIAISFDYSLFKEWFPNELTVYHSYMRGRQKLISKLIEDNVISVGMPHHLLGCGLPQEFSAYTALNFIDSVDTSNPVVAGIKGYRYNGKRGLSNKPKEKLFTMIEMKPSASQLHDIIDNIETFRVIVNG